MTGKTGLPDDTIVAAATPPGIGGVAVVRVSGPAAASIAEALAAPLPPPRHASLRTFLDEEGQPLDTGLLLYFPGPRSYTGEDVVEFHGHGGTVVVESLVAAAERHGARIARPGEFTERAFLNDRIDLVQAEAVADLIASGTRQAARAALRSLTGAFSGAVGSLSGLLIELRLHVEAAIDFPEEEIDFLDDRELRDRLDRTRRAFDELDAAASSGRLLRDGYRIVIAGRPNAGKSSLLNRLAGHEAAIVTDVAGTTRDILREQISVDGLAVELVDTAGLRSDPDTVEAEGIRRARAALESADAALWIRDGTAGDEPPPADLPAGLPVIVVHNKIDLTGHAPGADPADGRSVHLSALTGAGMDDLLAAIRRLAGYEGRGEGAFTARRRHLDALARARRHFDRGCRELAATRSGELLAEELRLAQQALGEITGEFTSDDLLGRIFAEFCIGK